MATEDLVGFLVRGLVDNPDDVTVSTVEGDAANILELRVNAEDVELVEGEDGETLEHIKALVSAASGKTKSIVELLEANDGSGEEE
ncbi:MAG: KH domain-containing protein [Proteobacteria bacterium]|nr:KH domain-containing protein [Pseudomonadota bacterium]MCP4921931.1 KH domain-containing protein [Pseudomonadota bacterium]